MDITSGAFIAALVVLAVLPLLGAVRTRRRGRRVGLAVVALGGAVLLIAALVNQHFGYVVHAEDLFGLHARGIVAVRAEDGPAEVAARMRAVGRPGRGVLLEVPVPGERSGIRGRSAYVYLPPQYFERAHVRTRFPVLELLHGQPGEPEDFLRSLDADRLYERALRKRATGPMVLVMPDGNGSRWRSTEGVDAVRGERAETYLTDDVATTVQRLFRVQRRGPHWGLAGFSVGGYAAVNLALRNQEHYGAAASMSGYFTAVEDEYTGALYRGSERAKRENSPLWCVAHRRVGSTAFYLMAGTDDDHTWKATPPFHRSLCALGEDVELAVEPGGGHTYRAWRNALPDVYNWAWTRVRPEGLHHAYPVERQSAFPSSGRSEGPDEPSGRLPGLPYIPRADEGAGRTRLHQGLVTFTR
ncbi:alpha/beta hydrolase [Streptomyces sp. KR80]|uniref:alpha/beta hydrolase n=1 Tax=Streptomyces sp. KR80 TaxID=3457426 RepID=UPI003FD305E8